MHAALVLALALPQTAPPAPAHVAEASLRLERTIELPDVRGRIDHLTLDRERGRLFVAALENGSLEVVDLREGVRAKRFTELGGPAGIAFVEGRGLVVVGCGSSGRLVLVDARSVALAGLVEGLPDADNVRWDAAHERVVVAYGEGGLALVDAKTWSVTARIELGAHPESFQLDARGERAFVNLPGKRAVALVDLQERKELARVELEGLRRNYPMLWDEAARVLAIGCREPAKLVLFDAAARSVAGALELAGDVDDVFLDAKRGRIYAACGAGSIDVFERDTAQSGAAAWKAKERVTTSDGARTCLFDAPSDRLYLAQPLRGATSAAIRVYAPQ